MAHLLSKEQQAAASLSEFCKLCSSHAQIGAEPKGHKEFQGVRIIRQTVNAGLILCRNTGIACIKVDWTISVELKYIIAKDMAVFDHVKR